MREMKESGIEWIGEIPAEWKFRKLKYFVNISSGAIIGKEDYVEDGDFPVVGSNGQIGRIDKVNNNEWVITTGRVGTVGTTHIVKDAWITDNALILYTRDIYQRYLAYIIPNFDFQYMLSGTAQPLITATKLKNQHTPVPTLQEQQKIADFLDKKCAEIDAVIEKTKATIEEYKKLKQSVITEAVSKGIRGNRPMKDSGIEWIGEVADTHPLKRLKFVCQILDQYRKPITADLRSQKGEILYDYYGASGAIDKIDDYTIDDHVMLIGEDGANLRMRNLPLMYEVKGKAWINNHAHILKPTEDTDFYYLFYALEALDISPYITGSAQPKLSQDNLKSIFIPMPDYQEQCEISKYLKSKCLDIDAIIEKKTVLLEEMEAYKKSVIYEYVTGKKEVI